MLFLLFPAAVVGLMHTYHPMPEYQFSWTPNMTASQLHVEITLSPPVDKSFGWVGFGISGSLGMLGGDMLTAYVTEGGDCEIQDRTADSVVKRMPTIDSTLADGFDDWVLDSCSRSGSNFTVSAHRDFVTYDAHDLNFVSGPMNLLFAWGQNIPSSPDELDYHNGGYLPKLVSLWGTSVKPFDLSALESDVDNVTLTMPDVPIHNGTTYTCLGFNLTLKNGLPTEAVAFEPLIQKENLPFVHHMVLYICRTPTYATPFECGISMPPACLSSILYAWGKGGNPIMLPSITGVPIGAPVRSYVALQMHYENQDEKPNLIDHSGLRIYRTNQVRQNQTGMLVLGSIQVNLTAGRTSIGLAGICGPSFTNQFPATGLNTYSSFVHMHQRGRRIWTNVIRGGELIGTVGRNLNYDFNLQTTAMLDPMVLILPGDQLITYCTFDTSKDIQNILYGEATNNEMCIHFLAFYPAYNLSSATSSCGVSGNPAGAKLPGPQSCSLLPDDPPAAYNVSGWTLSDSVYLTGGTATCAAGFTGTAQLSCPGYGSPYTFSGCVRISKSSAPTGAPNSNAPTPTSSNAPTPTSSNAPTPTSSNAPSTANSNVPTVTPSAASSGAPTNKNNNTNNNNTTPTPVFINSAFIPSVSVMAMAVFVFSI